MTHPSILEANVVAPGLAAGRYQIEVSGNRIRSINRIDPELGVPNASAGASPTGALRSTDVEVLAEDEVLLPAFVDAHTHLLGVGTARFKPNLRGSTSRDEAYERLEAWLVANPGDDPVIAEGWDQSLWPDRAYPTRSEIDRITIRPVALRRVCGHIAVLNSSALAKVGGGWDHVDFESGLARESLPLRLNRIWPRSRVMLERAFEFAQGEAFRLGVTSIQEMGDPTSYGTYARAEADGKLQLRVNHFFQVDALESVIAAGMTAGSGSEHLRIGGIKLFLDGSIGGRTAALSAPYADGRDRRADGHSLAEADGCDAGTLLFSDEELAAHLEQCAHHDLPVALHVIGDRAIEQAVRVLEGLSTAGVSLSAACSPRLEHAEMLTPRLRERAENAGFLFSMQPNFTARWQAPGGLYEQMLGPNRALALNPYRDAYRSGRLLFGSDTMPLDPLLGLRGACCHPDPAQRLSFIEALDVYTEGSSRGAKKPFGSGRLEAGQLADFVALRVARRGSRSGGATDGSSDVSSAAVVVDDSRGSDWFQALERTEMIGAAAGELLDRAHVSGTWVDGRCVYRLAPDRETHP